MRIKLEEERILEGGERIVMDMAITMVVIAMAMGTAMEMA